MTTSDQDSVLQPYLPKLDYRSVIEECQNREDPLIFGIPIPTQPLPENERFPGDSPEDPNWWLYTEY